MKMKTHELADALQLLAKALRRTPNVWLDEFTELKHNRSSPDAASIPVALSTLVALAEFDKSQWESLIRDFNLPIEIRPRDASRDILGKLLKHLEQNPDARNRMVHRAQEGRSKTSPELMRAMQLLLKT